MFGHHTIVGLPTQEQGVLYWGKTVRDPIFQSTGKILWNVKPEDAFFLQLQPGQTKQDWWLGWFGKEAVCAAEQVRSS